MSEQPTPTQSDPPTVVATVPAQALQLLAALGDTPDQIAANLHAAGITGKRGHCGTCPIAVYLMSSDLGCYAVDVDGVISLWFTSLDGVQHVEKISMPDAVNDFVCAFDTGRYDQLLAGGERRG